MGKLAYQPTYGTPRPATLSMPIDIEKRRATGRKANAKYRKTAKYLAARQRYKSTDEAFIVRHLRSISPEYRLAHQLYLQEWRSGKIQDSWNLE
jgi:hypothetical protein